MKRPGLATHPVRGAVIVAAIAVFYALILPFVSDTVAGGTKLEPGVPFPVSAGLEMVPQPGWELESKSEILTTLSRDGASLVVLPPAPGEDLEKAIETTVDGFENDPRNDWQVGRPEPFTTSAGDQGRTVVAYGTTEVQQTWLISHGGSTASIFGSSPDSGWSSLSPDMDEMVASVVFMTED